MADTILQSTQLKETLVPPSYQTGGRDSTEKPGLVVSGEITNFQISRSIEPQGGVMRGIEEITTVASVENVFGNSGLQTDVTTVEKPNSQLDPDQVGLNRQKILASAMRH